MRKYRVVVAAGGRKHTRHVRAADRDDAHRQATVIAAALEPDAMRAALGPLVVSVTEMGNVGRNGG